MPCGLRKVARIRARAVEGAVWSHPDRDPTLLTLTIPWKRRWETWEGFTLRHPNSLAHTLRAMTPKDRASWITKTWNTLCKQYERLYGERLTYLRTTESTKQGAPHIHAAILMPQGDSHWQLRHRIYHLWRQAVPDLSDQHGVHTTPIGGARNGSRLKSPASVIAYVTKYITKALEARPKDHKGIHSYGKSSDWEFPIIGPEAKFSLGTYLMNLHEYRRLYAIHNYYSKRDKLMPPHHWNAWQHQHTLYRTRKWFATYTALPEVPEEKRTNDIRPHDLYAQWKSGALTGIRTAMEGIRA